MIRILLAEDDEAMRTYLTRALENAGYSVMAVSSGTEALPMLETEIYDLLLSDIVMPEMDGIELAQRCNELSPSTKVMFITGFAAVALKANREAPHAKMLSKPFHLKDLVMEVERIFRDNAAVSL
ncbi:MAG: response regulator [Alteraurantiacibacter sp.]